MGPLGLRSHGAAHYMLPTGDIARRPTCISFQFYFIFFVNFFDVLNGWMAYDHVFLGCFMFIYFAFMYLEHVVSNVCFYNFYNK